MITLPEKTITRFFSVTTISIVVFLTVFALFSVFKHLYFDLPVNYYEPELVTEAYALANGQHTHGTLAEGPWSGLYAPLFQAFGALLFQVFPASIVVMRGISLVSLGVMAWMAYTLDDAKSPIKVLLWTLAVFQWHNFSGGFDLQAKPDSLAVMLALGALFVLRKDDLKWPSLILSALLAAFAVAAKQTMVFSAVAIGLFFLGSRAFRNLFVWSTSFVAFSAILWSVLSHLCGPTLFLSSFVIPGMHRLRLGVLSDGFNLMLTMPWVLLAAGLIFYRHFIKIAREFDTLLSIFWALTIPVSLLTLAKVGGQNNAFLPLWITSIFVIARNADTLLDFLKKQTQTMRAAILFLAALTALGNARINIPSEITRFEELQNYKAAYEALADSLRSIDETIYVPMDTYLAIKAGKPANMSMKSEHDFAPFLQLPPSQRLSTKRAELADIVITHRYAQWYQPDEFEALLQERGFIFERRVMLDRGLTLAVWKKQSS